MTNEERLRAAQHHRQVLRAHEQRVHAAAMEARRRASLELTERLVELEARSAAQLARLEKRKLPPAPEA